MSNLIKTACVQFCPEFGKTEGNLNKIKDYVSKVEADLIVFPELATSGYDFKDREELEKLAIDPESKQFLEILDHAARYDRHVVLGFAEKTADGLFNSSVLIEPGKRYSIYRKIHLFDREKKIFNAGDKDFFVTDTRLGRIGMMICFDWVFPEAARLLAIQGAQLICHPANLVLQFCQRAMFARSVENGVFSATCNRIGTEQNTDRSLTFTGASQILTNKGAELARASQDSEEVIAAELDLSLADHKWLTDNNHIIEDRRTEFYKKLTG